MAGELFTGNNPTCQSDVYAFGGLILTAMSGRAPFYSLCCSAIIRRVVTGGFPESEDHPDLASTDTIWGLIRRCWDKDPAAQPVMREVLWELWGYICHERSNLQTIQNRVSPSSVADGSVRESTSMRDSIAAGVLRSQTIFNKLETSCEVTPVFKKFVGAAAEAGLTLVEIAQTVDRNQDMASVLESNTWKLAVFLDRFQETLDRQLHDEIATCFVDIQRELLILQGKLGELYSSGLFPQALSCCDHTEGRKLWEGMAWKAWETMQLLTNLNTDGLVEEFKNPPVQEEQQRLLACLGDGEYGGQGNAIDSLPGTRVEILERINTWVRDAATTSRVLWIRGMAGRGKTMIASTVARLWRYRASCAIFHFRRGHSTLNERVLCALARQLGTSLVPEVKNGILETVRENRGIADQRLADQFETLLVAPLTKFRNQAHPILIVVDALDEFESSEDAVRFVELIDQHSATFPTNVKFLLTCRPEAPLLGAFEPREWRLEDLESDDVSGMKELSGKLH